MEVRLQRSLKKRYISVATASHLILFLIRYAIPALTNRMVEWNQKAAQNIF